MPHYHSLQLILTQVVLVRIFLDLMKLWIPLRLNIDAFEHLFLRLRDQVAQYLQRMARLCQLFAAIVESQHLEAIVPTDELSYESAINVKARVITAEKDHA